jgi:DNA-binding MarR family transcriptional regulator
MNKKQASNSPLPWDNPRFRNWIAVARACNAMQTVMSRALQPLDLKTPHLDILANLYRFEGLTQQELARKLLVGRSNMSMLLPQMEKRGLIERHTDERDKRVLRLYLTPEGRELTEKALAIQMQVIDRSMQVSTAEECDMVGDLMNRMIASLKDELD